MSIPRIEDPEDALRIVRHYCGHYKTSTLIEKLTDLCVNESDCSHTIVADFQNHTFVEVDKKLAAIAISRLVLSRKEQQ